MGADAAMSERDVEVNRITVRYTTWGQHSRPGRTVLLVHGLTSNRRAWAKIAPALAARGWFVVAPDLRGRGASSKPPHGYSIPHHASDLLALCDALQLPTVSAVGHSLGAQITLFLAAIYPDRVNRIVLVDAGARFPPDVLDAIAASLARLDIVYPSLDAYLQAMAQAPIHTWNPFWEQYYCYDAQIHPDGTVTSRVPRSAIEEEIAVRLKAMDLDGLCGSIRVPTLVVRATVGLLGPDRGLVLPREEADHLARAIPGCRVVNVADTNHYTVLLSDELQQEVVAFLEEGAGIGGGPLLERSGPFPAG